MGRDIVERLTDKELQSLRNLGNESERAADEIERLQQNNEKLLLDNLELRNQSTELRAEVEALRAELLDTTWQDHADAWQKRSLKAEAEVEALRALLQKAGAAIHYHRREQGYDKSQLESEIEAMLAAKEQP